MDNYEESEMNLLNYINTLYPKPPTDEEMKLRRERLVNKKCFTKKHAEQLKEKACSYRF